MKANWQKLINTSFSQLTEARKQIHQAVQLAALTGRAYLPKVDDDHFASLKWDKEKSILSGQAWGKDNYKTSLNFSDLSLLLLNRNNEVVNNFSLSGKTYNEGFEWLKTQVTNTGEDAGKLSLSLPYEIPVYPWATGEKFNLFNQIYFEEISRYFANANLVLETVVNNNSEATEIACWPHHFDIATLLVLNESSDNYKSVGVGLSPGDDNYNEPYFYITPWPYPNTNEIVLPELPSGGFWHTENWVGAILTGTEIIKFESAEEQLSAVQEFLSIGINAAKELV